MAIDAVFMGIVYDYTGWWVWFLGFGLCVGRLGLMGWRFWEHGFGGGGQKGRTFHCAQASSRLVSAG